MSDAVPQYGTMRWMDPGHPDTLRHTLRVVQDLVRRYDLDGLHIDDYFYPYPQTKDGKKLEFPDDATYAAYQKTGGKLDRSDWRRENVNRMVQEMYRTIKKTKPYVKFGISPFGIWRPGHPDHVKGMDQYEAIYADAKLWLEEGWCDYFTPQLYWNIENPDQSFIGLLNWWIDQTPQDRHLYPGLYTSRTADGSSREFDGQEIGYQVRWSRILLPEQKPGHVHFSMKAFMENRAGLRDSLPQAVYATPALPPAMPWLKSPDRLRPIRIARARLVDDQYELELPSAALRAARWVTVQYPLADGETWRTHVYPAQETPFKFPAPPVPASADDDDDDDDASDRDEQMMPAPRNDVQENLTSPPVVVWVRTFDRLGKSTSPLRVELVTAQP